MCYASAEDLSKSVRAAVFAARENLAPDEWVERNWLVQSGERKGSPMDLSRTPQVRMILRFMAEAGVVELVVGGDAQSAKTETIMAGIAWTMEQRPGTWMVMLPKATKAEDNNVGRFLPAIEANPKLAKLLVGEQKRSLLKFKGGEIHWIGSESLSGAEGTPAPYVWIDEYDRCDETGRKKLEQRGKTFSRQKRIKTGTPGMAGEGIDAAYEACDVRWRWHVPCPHADCLKYYMRVWSKLTVVWEGGPDAPVEDVRRNAWYACPHCGRKSLAKDRAWQGRLGMWVAHTQVVGPVVREAGRADQPGIVSGKIPPGQSWGIWWHGLDNDLRTNPVAEVAAEFVKEVRSHGRPGMVWETETLGRAVVVRERRLVVEHLKARATAGTHVRGHAPAGTVAIVGAMDVQTDRVFWMTLALGPRMQDVYLLDWGEERDVTTEGGIVRAMQKVLGTKYPVVGGPPMKVSMIACDTGHRATEVYSAKARIGSAVKLVKGEASRDGKNKDLFRLTKTAVEQVSPLNLLLVNTTPWKTTAANLLMRPLKDAVKEREAGGGDETLEETGMAMHLPRDVDDALLGQLCSERFVSGGGGGGGGGGGLWQLIKEGLANHWWDCLIYGLAMAVYYQARKLTQRLDVPKAPETTHGEGQGRQERESVGGGRGGGGGGGGGGSRGILTG